MDDRRDVQPRILAKLQEVRRIVDAARWGLLDVVVCLNEIEADHQAVQQDSAEVRSGLLDVEEGNHEDYVPEGNGSRSSNDH